MTMVQGHNQYITAKYTKGLKLFGLKTMQCNTYLEYEKEE